MGAKIWFTSATIAVFSLEELMPINCPVCMRDMDQEEFARLDYRVMACAFESQNELGRLCDEVVYQNDLAARLEAAGVGPIRKEVPVMLSQQDFIKTYSLDLVVADAAIYELKTDHRLVPEHEAQLLNYLFLQDAQHGKLVNFRPAQVESKFVNNQLAPEARRQLEIDTQRWRETDSTSTLVRATLVPILEDWGGFLELPVYTQALTHFLGGEEKVNTDGASQPGKYSIGKPADSSGGRIFVRG